MLRRKNVKYYIMSVWQLETSIDWQKSIRASFPCKSRHLWKRSIYLSLVHTSDISISNENKACLLLWDLRRQGNNNFSSFRLLFYFWLMLELWSYAYGYDNPYVTGLTSFLCFAFCLSLCSCYRVNQALALYKSYVYVYILICPSSLPSVTDCRYIKQRIRPVHTETFSFVFVLFQVMSWLFSIPLRTVNNTKTQESGSVCTGPNNKRPLLTLICRRVQTVQVRAQLRRTRPCIGHMQRN